jgi:hypothetical protein
LEAEPDALFCDWPQPVSTDAASTTVNESVSRAVDFLMMETLLVLCVFAIYIYASKLYFFNSGIVPRFG